MSLVERCRNTAIHSRASLVILWLATALFLASAAHSATLPSGFAETRIATGLASPTAMSFAPDGRLFVCEQGGKLRVIKNGALLATPFVTLSVNSSGERGLLGVAFDPDFATNGFVYIYYTTSASPVQPGEPLHGEREQSRRRRCRQRGSAAEPAEPQLGHESQRRRDSLRQRRQALHCGRRERELRQFAVAGHYAG